MTATSPRHADAARAAAALDRLAELHPKLIDLGLGRTFELLSRLDDPHLRLPPTIHVAGTNGKGSTIAQMRAMAEAAGLRVHVYSSPHLCHFNERIRLAGRLIENGPLADLLEEVEARNGDRPVTFFEVTTAAAMLAFSRTPADLLLLETGLGGALDSTNVLRRPAATVITPIARDHEHFLGDDIAGIAGQKAGIMRAGVTCFCAKQTPEAARALVHHAASTGAGLRIADRDFHIAAHDDGGFQITCSGKSMTFPAPGLRGAHQIDNAGLAAATLLHVLPDIDPGSLAAGLPRATWPGRVQKLNQGHLVDRHGGGPIWLDGAHNAHGAKALAAAIRDINPGPWTIVCGALNTRDPQEFLAPLKPIAGTVHCLTIPDQPASLSGNEMAATAHRLDLTATAHQSLTGAIDTIGQKPQLASTPLVICGSLYLAGHVLLTNATPPN